MPVESVRYFWICPSIYPAGYTRGILLATTKIERAERWLSG